MPAVGAGGAVDQVAHGVVIVAGQVDAVGGVDAPAAVPVSQPIGLGVEAEGFAQLGPVAVRAGEMAFEVIMIGDGVCIGGDAAHPAVQVPLDAPKRGSPAPVLCRGAAHLQVDAGQKNRWLPPAALL